MTSSQKSNVLKCFARVQVQKKSRASMTIPFVDGIHANNEADFSASLMRNISIRTFRSLLQSELKSRFDFLTFSGVLTTERYGAFLGQ